MKTGITFAMLCSIMLTQSTITHAKNHNCENGNHHDLLVRLAVSTIPSVILGGMLGNLCARVEEESLPWPLSWFMFSGLRTVLINIISSEMSQCNVPHHAQLMQTLAWIADWSAYLKRDRVILIY